MLDPVLGDLAADVRRVALGVKLAGVNADDNELILIFFFELGQVGKDVMAVDAAERPEIEQDDLAAQLGKSDRAGVDPVDASSQARRRRLDVYETGFTYGLLDPEVEREQTGERLVKNARPRTTQSR